MARSQNLRFIALALGTMAAALAGACAPGAARVPAGAPRDVPRSIRVQQAGQVRAIPLEEYVLGASLSEVTPAGESAAVAARVFEVQAIIARTYAAATPGRHRSEDFDLCDTTHCQLYEPGRLTTSSYAAVARAAVTRTAGRILRFNGRPAETLFHADCGGYTTTPRDAWGGPALPYLPAAPDDVPGRPHRAWHLVATDGEWADMLNRDPRTRMGGRLRDLRVVSRDSSGRATLIEIAGNRSVRASGATLRAVVSGVRGPRALLSTRFDISRTPAGFRLDGTGFGHGVGLCQLGSIARARRGDSAETILGHYYPGAR